MKILRKLNTSIIRFIQNVFLLFWIIGFLLILLITAAFSRDRSAGLLDRIDRKLIKRKSTRQVNRVVGWLNRIAGMFPFRNILTNLGRRAGVDEKVLAALKPEKKQKSLKGLIKKYKRFVWENWVGIQKSEPLHFLVPGHVLKEDPRGWAERYDSIEFDYQTLALVREIVRDCKQDGLNLRCVASGHALSDIAVSNDVMMSTAGFTSPQRRADQFYIKEQYRNGFTVDVNFGDQPTQEKHYLFETGAGTKIKYLNEMLHRHGLAMQNMGGTDVQGYMGGAATATHGTGIQLGSYSDCIRSMIVIKADTSVIRLEPKDGITDPVAYRKFNRSLKPNQRIRLVQDDQLFYSMITNIGCMGIVYSVTIEVQPKFELFEQRHATTWSAVRKKLVEGGREFINQHRHLNILINPYKIDPQKQRIKEKQMKASHNEHLRLAAKDNYCLVTTIDYAEDRENDKKEHPEERRNYFSSLFAGLRFTSIFAVWLFNRRPFSIPLFIVNSLHRLVDSKDGKNGGGGYIDRSYKVFNQGLGHMRDIGYAIEIGFRIEDVPEVVDRIIELTQQWADPHEHYICAPIALRFVRRSKAYMSMSNGHDVCMIEIIVLKGVIASNDLLHRLETQLVKEFSGRPHWGLNVGTLTREQVEHLYPEFDRWEESLMEMDPDGLFANSFTKRLELGGRIGMPIPMRWLRAV